MRANSEIFRPAPNFASKVRPAAKPIPVLDDGVILCFFLGSEPFQLSFAVHVTDHAPLLTFERVEFFHRESNRFRFGHDLNIGPVSAE